MPRVSIVVPAYNYGRFLPDCLGSILPQPHRDLEVMVVDDGSTDNTEEVVVRFLARVRYFRQENQGVGAAMNQGIELAMGEYIRFVDADDMVLESGLEPQVALLDSHPRVGLVYGQAYQVNEKGETTLLRRPGFARGSYIRSGRQEIAALLFGIHITKSTVMLRRKCFDKVGLFPEIRDGEDWLMFIRIAKEF